MFILDTAGAHADLLHGNMHDAELCYTNLITHVVNTVLDRQFLTTTTPTTPLLSRRSQCLLLSYLCPRVLNA